MMRTDHRSTRQNQWSDFSISSFIALSMNMMKKKTTHQDMKIFVTILIALVQKNETRANFHPRVFVFPLEAMNVVLVVEAQFFIHNLETRTHVASSIEIEDEPMAIPQVVTKDFPLDDKKVAVLESVLGMKPHGLGINVLPEHGFNSGIEFELLEVP